MFTTKETGHRLIWFAFRIIHRIIGTKTYLNKLKIYCSICLHEPESVTHLFFYCPFVARNLVMTVLLDFTKDREKKSI